MIYLLINYYFYYLDDFINNFIICLFDKLNFSYSPIKTFNLIT